MARVSWDSKESKKMGEVRRDIVAVKRYDMWLNIA